MAIECKQNKSKKCVNDILFSPGKVDMDLQI